MQIYDYTMHWSIPSAVFYVILGFLGMWGMYCAKRQELVTGKTPTYKNKYLVVWWSIWTLVAVLRFVDLNVGGSDAPSYVFYFDNCNGPTKISWFEHVEGDVGFKWLNKSIRFFFADYHVYFLIVYGFIFYAYIAFLNRFSSSKTNFIPYILGFFLVLRSFNTLRSNFAIALIAMGCIFVLQRKWKIAYILAFSAILFHKSSVIYGMCIPFCHFFYSRKMSVKMGALLIVTSALIGGTMQSLFLQYAANNELNGAYASYAARSIGNSFLINGWKIAFEQIVLGMVMFAMKQRIGNCHGEFDKQRLKIVWMLCVYDLMMVPINFIMGSWRGYEFFYLARIIMWGECIHQLTKDMNSKSRWLISFFLLILFIVWMIFRVYATWSDSRLMPYIFEPLLYL